MEHTISLLDRFRNFPVTASQDNAETPVVGIRNESTAGTFSLSPRTVVRYLMSLAFGLLLVNIVVLIADHATGYELKMVQRLVKVFSVDRELNFPAFFSTLILLFSSLLLAVIAILKHKRTESTVWYWALLSLGFLFMAFDEMASIHERLIEPMRTVLGEQNLGVFYFAWVVPAIALVAILGVIFVKFWWNLPPKTRTIFLIAAMLYLGGAIGVELIDGNYAEIYGKTNLTYMLLSTAEEALEMAGIIVFIYGLLGYISNKTSLVVIRFNNREEQI